MNKQNFNIKKTFSFGLQNHKKNNFKAAENFYKEVLKVEPNHFESIFYLGSLYAQIKKFTMAKQLFKKAIYIRPDLSDTYNNLGAIHKELGEYREAIDHCKKAIHMRPDYAAAFNNLGAVYIELGEYKQAKNFCQKASEIQSDLTSAYRNLGIIFKELGEINNEVKSYDKLSKIQSNPAYAHQNLGRLNIVLGDTKKAIVSYQKALKHEPENLCHYYNLAYLDDEFLDTELKNKINNILKISGTSKQNLAYGNYLLSKYALKEKNYKREFQHLIKGHLYYFESEKEKFKKEVDYWLNILPKKLRQIDLIKYEQRNKATLKPIFIVGVPRSGSTLVEKIVASGTKFLPIGEETGIFGFFVRKLVKDKHQLNNNIDDIKNKIIERYDQKGLIQEKYGYTFTDKTLDNFFYIDLIKKIFPHAKIINCKRNPLASIISILQNNLPGLAWTHNIKNIFKYFDIYYKTMENYKKRFPNFIYDLEFEKLLNNPEKESKKLMKYCNLSWNKKCLEFYKRKDLISRTSSNIQIRKAIYKDKNKRYLPYKKFLKEYKKKYKWFS